MKCVSLAQILRLAIAILLSFCTMGALLAQSNKPQKNANVPTEEKQLETATFGGGCFWCIEAVYQRVDGVTKVVSGYAGGTVENPTYQAVSAGNTGHAEVCQITFDPSIVSFEQMLEVFFSSHDPTSLNRQGPDAGTQYRSVVFYNDDAQRDTTEKVMERLAEEKKFKKKIVTEVSPLPVFYPAEQYHQNYFVTHPGEGYCRNVIAPKIEKFEKQHKDESKMHKAKVEKKAKK